MSRITEWVRAWIKYVTEDIWHLPLADLPRHRSFIVREIRILVLAFRGFNEDKIQLRASALTFYTLLSIVPIVAIAFGVARGFGFDQRLEAEIIKAFTGHETVMIYVLQLARGFLAETSGVFIGVVGLVILMWSVMQVIDNIERSFNYIWQIRKSRPWLRKFADYISFMIFGPVFLILASSFTVYVSTMIDNISREREVIESIKPAIVFLLRFAPYFFLWIFFTFLYIVMPNTRVRFKSALVAGVMAGTMFQIIQYLYIHFQVGVTKYNALYGSFAAFPLFIIWMQASWLVVLLGAELSFANQNVNKYEFESDSLNISNAQRKILSLMLMNVIAKRFASGAPPLSAVEMAQSLQIPVRIARDLLYQLSEAGLITEISIEAPRERYYQPAVDIRLLRISYIITRLDLMGSADVPVARNEQYKKIVGLISGFDEKMRESEEDKLISEI
jgi:membrane protein